MKTKTALFLLFPTVILGSFINFYASNLLFSDLSNMFYGTHDAYIISSFPLFTVALDFAVFAVFLMRFAHYPQYRRSLATLYSVFLGANSAVGLITAILTGTVIYPSPLAPYPFPGCTLLMLILHPALIVLSVFLYRKSKAMPQEGQERKKIRTRYVLYSILLGGMIYYAFYDLGSVLWLPSYLHLRTLYLTFPFYLSMLCPIALFIHVSFYFLGIYRGKEKAGIFVAATVTAVSIALSVAVMALGSRHTEFIAAISPALPLERLATLPLSTIFQFVAAFLFGGYYLFYAIRAYRIAKQGDRV